MTKKIIISLAAVFALAFGVLYGKGLMNVHQQLTPPAKLVALETPQPAPDVAFFDAKGVRHPLSEFRGRYVLLNLWATWCAPCVAELPALARLKAAAPGLRVLAVDVGRDKADAATDFLKSHHASFLGTLVDNDITLVRAFGAPVMPTTVLIDPDGKVVARAQGAEDWATTQNVAYFNALAPG
jgi:thiol-disulfide isomerase/thioredoxin